MSKNLTFGFKTTFVADVDAVLNITTSNGLKFVAIPLYHPRFRRDVQGISHCRLGPGTRSDRVLDNNTWVKNIVGCISDWIDLDNHNESIQKSSEVAWNEEIMWAAHLGLQSILLPFQRKVISPNYARSIAQVCNQEGLRQQIWLRVPLASTMHHSESCHTDGWKYWNTMHKLCNYNHSLCICLEIGAELPNDFNDSIKRWGAEPVKAIILSTDIFVVNRKGFPVLSKSHQAVLNFFLQFKIHIILEGKPKHSDSYVPYIQYIEFLNLKANPTMSEEEKFTAAYHDTLQSPLQPLMDNLESNTYEVFERDPVKYQKYEEAIQGALVDTHRRRNHDNSSDVLVCTVVGAGRGPLVACILSASASTSIPVRVYAVEKNANAVITLRNRAITELWDNVRIIHSDMRDYVPEELADILVSELLGSWGDNELSPECLDGANRLLRPSGISIPQRYTSFVAPMSSSRLWMGARDIPNGKGLETPFVVKFHACHVLATSKPLFTFEHPNISGRTNMRYKTVTFISMHDTIIHGFAGTFECDLYNGVMLSINPQTHTTGMFSWFPIFIPLQTPLAVNTGDEITFCCWRRVDARKVWYEWCIVQPEISTIQNCNGRSYWIGLH